MKNYQRDQLILEDINSRGWLQLHQQLVANGSDKPKKNLKLLIKMNGNIEQCLDKLKHKQQHKMSRAMIEQNVQTLVEYGFYDVKENKKALRKSDGDIVKALELLVDGPIKQKIELPPVDLQQITHYYLDGNNMLFCIDEIRQLYLSKQKKAAQRLLYDKIAKFLGPMKPTLVYLIFDSTTDTMEQDIDGTKYVVASAHHQQFETSDDCLVVMADSVPKSSLFVTSDRELTMRLNGHHVIKSGTFTKMINQ